MSEEIGRFRQESDLSRNPLLATVLALTLLSFAIGTVWGYGILVKRLEALRSVGPKSLPAEANDIGVGIVIHAMFEPAGDWPPLNRRKEERLATYGWVDRGRGRIHLPIERAMELTVQDQAARPDKSKEQGQ